MNSKGQIVIKIIPDKRLYDTIHDTQNRKIQFVVKIWD